jgi:hypothetical protein
LENDEDFLITQCNSWMFRVEFALGAKGFLEIVKGIEPTPTCGETKDECDGKDQKARGHLALAMEVSEVKHITRCSTSHEMWKRLESIYEEKSGPSKSRLRGLFYNFKVNEGKSIKYNLADLDLIVAQLKTCGVTLDDEELYFQGCFMSSALFRSICLYMRATDRIHSDKGQSNSWSSTT